MANFMRGRFYEFHVERVISRPGQPITTAVGAEIGPEIPKEVALRQVREGMDVYTLNREDAYKLSTSINAARPLEHAAHNQAFYAHYHPGGVAHEYDPARPGRLRANMGPGHVFYGDRRG
ncbi:MAG: hypothetical protein ABSH39_23480 [Candidatus Acidiferrum sp.]|jgi:hypothetical protein